MGRSYSARPSGVFAPNEMSGPGEPPGLWKSKVDSGFVPMEYIGEEDNPEPILAPSRRSYKFDKGEHKTVLVHHLDVNYIRYLGVAK